MAEHEKNGAGETVENQANHEENGLLGPYAKAFFGSYSHSLDNKGRMVIPQSFRENLGEKFCIAPSFDFRSIAIYPPAKWSSLRASYDRLGRMNASLNRFLEQFDALSYLNQECDAQGRVLLPGGIRQRILKDERDVEITGANDHIRVVAATREEESWSSFLNDLPDILTEIGSLEAREEMNGSK